MPWSRNKLLLLAGFVAAYTFFLAWYHCPYAGGSDSSGYMNSARLLLEGRLTTPVRTPEGLTPEVLSPQHFLPLGFRLDETQQNLVPTYPIGLPLHFAALGWLIGLDAASTVVGVGSALLFALLLYLTGREFGVTRNWSLGLAVIAALSPLTLTYALQPMSDLVATGWTLAVILCALRSPRHTGWAAGAGAALAMAVLVRPTNALLVLPALLALQPSLRTWIAFGFGGVPGALFLAGYNHALYGTYLTSGYGDVSSLFAARHIPTTFGHYARWVPVVATPLVFAALALPWLTLERRKKLTLLAWAGCLLLFYSAYECTQETWWYLRFILPALPALGIAAALALQQIRYPSWFLISRVLPATTPTTEVAGGRILRLPLTLLLLLAATGWMLAWDREYRVTFTELDDRAYPLAGRWINNHLPVDAVLVAYQVSGALYYYTDRPVLNPNNLSPEESTRLAAWLRAHKRVLYAALYPHEESVVRQRLPGRWEKVAELRRTTIWRLLDADSTAPSR